MEGINLIVNAILKSSKEDLEKYLRRLYKSKKRKVRIYGEKQTGYIIKYELNRLYEFYSSEWFVILMNGKDIRSDMKDYIINRMFEEWKRYKNCI